MMLPVKIPNLILNKNPLHEIKDCYMRQCCPDDYTEISGIQKTVVADLATKEHTQLFIPTEENVIRDFLERDDVLFLCVETPDGICAYSYTFFSNDIEYNLCSYFDIRDVATFDTVVVLPPFRGNKLHDQLLKVSIQEAKKRNSNIIASTVSPDNIHSVNNFIKNGFEILKILNGGEGYEGYKRYIMYKKII